MMRQYLIYIDPLLIAQIVAGGFIGVCPFVLYVCSYCSHCKLLFSSCYYAKCAYCVHSVHGIRGVNCVLVMHSIH